MPPSPSAIRSKLRRFVEAVQADHGWIRTRRAKYRGETIGPEKLLSNAVTMIGFQMVVGIRVMHLLKDLKIPLGPQVASRLIRHLYGAEIHWDAEIAPGLTLVHGNGLVISKAAKVSGECILSQNVTLGMGLDPATRRAGAPTLERNVHIGPGATLLGPITVGEGSKIMAGAVVVESVPPNSVVKPAPAEVQSRRS